MKGCSMTMAKALLAIAAIIFLANSDANAVAALQDIGKEQFLYDQCVKDDPTTCMVYLRGIAKVMITLGDAYKSPALDREVAAHIGPTAICLKGSPVIGEVLRRVYLAWLDLHPEQKQDAMGSAAMDAFAEAWPCKGP